MSRYESSKFIKDPKTMNQDALKQACDTLGWKYKLGICNQLLLNSL